MKTTSQISEASAPANVRPSSVSKHHANRGLSTEAVLNLLRAKLPQQYERAEVVGKWVWLDVSPARKPMLAKVLWSLGFHWNQDAASGSIRAAVSIRSARIPPTRVPSIAATFPPMFCRLEHGHQNGHQMIYRGRLSVSIRRLSNFPMISQVEKNIFSRCIRRPSTDTKTDTKRVKNGSIRLNRLNLSSP